MNARALRRHSPAVRPLRTRHASSPRDTSRTERSWFSMSRWDRTRSRMCSRIGPPGWQTGDPVHHLHGGHPFTVRAEPLLDPGPPLMARQDRGGSQGARLDPPVPLVYRRGLTPQLLRRWDRLGGGVAAAIPRAAPSNPSPVWGPTLRSGGLSLATSPCGPPAPPTRATAGNGGSGSAIRAAPGPLPTRRPGNPRARSILTRGAPKYLSPHTPR